MKVTLIMAITVDGKIGKDPDHFPDWTGKEDKRLFKTITQKAGVVIMGSKTFDTIGSPLPGRKNIVLTRRRDRLSKWPNLVFTEQSPKEILNGLQKDGFSDVVLAGGAGINMLFARANLIDEIIVTIAPKIFGAGISLFEGEIDLALALEDVKKLGKDLILARYSVIKDSDQRLG
ncbi:MAG: dihydrofolate reductase [Desulfobacteraceae bacterium 4572_123]|nr:MAG: dihydrofolate reductase [Desulfobacteraceae bacterium 4572_123]